VEKRATKSKVTASCAMQATRVGMKNSFCRSLTSRSRPCRCSGYHAVRDFFHTLKGRQGCMDDSRYTAGSLRSRPETSAKRRFGSQGQPVGNPRPTPGGCVPAPHRGRASIGLLAWSGGTSPGNGVKPSSEVAQSCSQTRRSAVLRGATRPAKHHEPI
jgi:hypothetical protein